MFLFSKGKALAVVFMLVATTYVVLLVNAELVKKREVESFEVSTTTTTTTNAAYDGRKQVISIFESMFKRKPTTDEIEKYASFGSRKAILNAILADFDKLEVIGQSAATEPKTDPLPPAPAPAPAARVVDPFDQEDGSFAPVVVAAPPPPTASIADKITAFEAAWQAVKMELTKRPAA